MRTHRTLQPPAIFEVALLAILAATAIVCCYFALDDRNAALLRQGTVFFAPRTSFDDRLPLVPELIFAYCLFYPAFLGVAAVALTDRTAMYEAFVTYVTTAAAGFVIFLIVPSRMEQPDLSWCDTLSCRLLARMYEVDDGFNIFPSEHVAYPVAVCLMLRHNCPRLFPPFVVATLLIMASTVLLKRHYVVDVPAGIALGVATWGIGRVVGPALARTLAFLDSIEPADRV